MMNCEQAERLMLLSASGEMPARKQADLQRHLSVCSQCAEFLVWSGRVEEAVKRASHKAEPSPDAVASVMRNANAALSSTRRRPTFARRRASASAFALAASLLICFGLWLISGEKRLQQRPELEEENLSQYRTLPTDPFEELTASTWNDLLQVESVSELQRQPEVSLTERELLVLHGLAI